MCTHIYMCISFTEFEGTMCKYILDWRAMAKAELGETPQVVKESIEELRRRLEKAGISCPRDNENLFLLRFLRVSKFNVRQAFERVKAYFKNRQALIPVGRGPCDYKQIYAAKLTTTLPQLDFQRR